MVSLAVVLVTCGQPWSKNVKQKIPEINNKQFISFKLYAVLCCVIESQLEDPPPLIKYSVEIILLSPVFHYFCWDSYQSLFSVLNVFLLVLVMSFTMICLNVNFFVFILPEVRILEFMTMYFISFGKNSANVSSNISSSPFFLFLILRP